MTLALAPQDEWVIQHFRAQLAALPEAPEPTIGQRHVLSPGVWVVRSRSWKPSSSLDGLADLPVLTMEVLERELPVLDWQAEAACQNMGWLLFFGQDDAPTEPTLTLTALRMAQKVCDTCEVERTCLVWSLLKSESHGVWGSMSARQRKPHLRVLKKLPVADRVRVAEAIADEWLATRPT